MTLYLTSCEMTLETFVLQNPRKESTLGLPRRLPPPRKDSAVRWRLAVGFWPLAFGGWLQAGVSPTENQRASFGTGLKCRYFYPFLVKIPAGSQFLTLHFQFLYFKTYQCKYTVYIFLYFLIGESDHCTALFLKGFCPICIEQ